MSKEIPNHFGSNQITEDIPGKDAGIFILRLENLKSVSTTKLLRVK